MTVGHLNTFFAQVAGNLKSQILKSSNSRRLPGGGMLKFRIDRYITRPRVSVARCLKEKMKIDDAKQPDLTAVTGLHEDEYRLISLKNLNTLL